MTLRKVRILPADLVIDVRDGTTLMAGAREAGVRWPTICGGVAQCGVCVAEVLETDAALEAAGKPEATMLARSLSRPMQGGALRLACQMAVRGDMTVFQRAVRKPAS